MFGCKFMQPQLIGTRPREAFQQFTPAQFKSAACHTFRGASAPFRRWSPFKSSHIADVVDESIGRARNPSRL
jgi:hypothetical protein